MRFTALFHHIYDPQVLRAAYSELKREAAAGGTGRRGGTTVGPLRKSSRTSPIGRRGSMPGHAGV